MPPPSLTAAAPATLRGRPLLRSTASWRGLSAVAAGHAVGRGSRALPASRASASDEIEGWAPAGDLGWEVEPPGSDDEGDLDLFPPEEGGWGGPGYLLQNAVAVGLAALLALAAGDVALKLLVVAYSLVAAGFRYTVIALLLLVLISLFR